MSTHIEHEVVSMQFDNKHFESNVRTSLRTLDKLKDSLKLHDAAKGFENISTAAKKVDLHPLSNAVDKVGLKFNALYTIADQALRNIVTRVQHYAERMVAMFTIDPVKTGFSEYELKMGSIQTIMASTGESLETVNGYLEELNAYSDKTIYSFSDMTTNIGKFTNAGVKLEDAVMAIQGIANVAAVSGANANEASRAMYNFAQALSAGYVKLLDWKSIELANMATVEFKTQLLEAAVAAGTLTKAADGTYKTLNGTVVTATKNFNESLADQWMTTEVLINTLGDYADETTEIGKKASQAATEVKTFTQMMDTLKETAQSGWAQTWELIFGDFEEGKSLWTSINNVLSGLIDKTSKWRNDLLRGALDNSGWDKMIGVVKDAKIEVSEFEEEIKKLAKEHDIDIDAIIEEYGSLEAAVQACKIPVDLLKKAFDNLFRGTDSDGDGFKEYVVKEGDTLSELAEKWGTSVEEIMLLNKFITDPDMILTGWVLKIPGAIEETGDAAKESRNYVEEFVDALNGVGKMGGRELLIESFANLWSAIKKIVKPIRNAFRDIFEPLKSEQIYSVIERFNKFTHDLDYHLGRHGIKGKLYDTFKGVFSLVSIIGKIIGGGLKLGWKVFTGILDNFGLSVLDFTAGIGKAITKLNEWIDSGIDKGVDWLIGAVKWLYNLPGVQKIIESFTDAWSKLRKIISVGWGNLKDWWSELDFSEGISLDGIKKAFTSFYTDVVVPMFGGLIEKLKKFGSTVKTESGKIWSSIKEWWSGLKLFDDFSFENVKKTFVDFYTKVIKPLFEKEDGTTIFDGFLDNIKKFANAVLSWFGDRGVDLIAVKDKIIGFVSGIVDYFKEHKGSLVSLVSLISVFWLVKKALDVAKLFGNSISFLTNISESFENIGKKLQGSLRAAAIKSVAEAIAILAASITVLAFIPAGKLWGAIGAMTVISVILVGVFALSSLIANKLGTADLAKFAGSMLAVSGALMIFALAANVIGTVEDEALKKTAGVLLGFVAMIGALMILSGIAGPNSSKIFQSGSMLLGLGAFLILLSVAIKRFGEMDPTTLSRGLFAVTVLLAESMLIMIATNKLAKVGKKQSVIKTGGLFASLGIALLTMAGVVSILGNMSTEALVKGLIAVTLIIFLLAGVMTATNKLARYNKDVTGIVNIGGLFAGIGAALLMIAGAVAIFGHMDTSTLVKGGVAIAVFLGLMVGIMAATNLLAVTGANKQFAKVGGTIMAMSAGLILIAASVALLSLIDKDDLIKAGIAIAGIMVLFTMMITATSDIPKGSIATVIGLTVGIAVLAGSLIAIANLVDETSLKNAAIALGSVMLVFAAMLKFVSKIKLGSAITTLLMAGLIAGLMYLVVEKLSGMSAEQVETAKTMVGAMSKLILAIAASCMLLTPVVKAVSGLSLNGIGTMFLGLVAIAAVLLGVGAAAIAALPWLGTQLATFAKNASPFFLALGALAVSGAGGSLKAIGDTMTALADLTATVAEVVALDKILGGDIFAKGADGFSNLDRMVEWYKSIFDIAKSIALELSVEGLVLNHENIKSVMRVVETLAMLASSVPATIKASGGAGGWSKLGVGGLGGAVEIIPMLEDAKNWIKEVFPIVKEVALELSGKGVSINKTNLDAVVGAASELASAAALAPSTTIAGGAFVSKWVSAGGGVIDVPMITAAADWIYDVAPTVRKLAESVTSGKAKDLDKDALDAVCTGVKTLAEAAALAPSWEAMGGFVAGPGKTFAALGKVAVPRITSTANFIVKVREPIELLATSVKTLGFSDIDRTNFETIIGAIKTIGEIEYPTFTVGGGLAKFAGGIGGAFGWNTPVFTALAVFICQVKDPIIKLANAISGVSDGQGGAVFNGELDTAAFEAIIGAIKTIGEIKFPTITVGGGLAKFAGGIAGAFGYDAPQLTELATFITDVKDPIIDLANAVSGTGEGKVLENEFDAERFETILGAIVKLAEIKFPTITAGGGFAAFAGGIAGAFGYDAPQLNELTTFITNSKDAIIGLANAVSGTGEGNVITGEFNKENFESIVGAIAQLASIVFPTVTEGGGWVGFIGPVSGFIEASGSSIADFKGLVDFIKTAKDPIIDLANAVSGTGEGNVITGDFDKTAFESIVGALAQLASVQYPTIDTVHSTLHAFGGFGAFVGGLDTESKADFEGFVDFIEDVKQPIVDLATKVSGDDVTIDNEKLTSICTAITNLATASKDIPVNSWVGRTFTGVTDFTSFTEFISSVGPSIASMDAATKELNLSDENNNINKSVSIIASIAKLSKDIPKVDFGIFGWYKDKATDFNGFLSFIGGDDNGEGGVGESLVKLQNNLSEFNFDDIGKVTSAITALGSLATAANYLPEITSSFWGLWKSETDWDGFETNCPKMATGITSFSENLGDVNLEAMTIGAQAALSLSAAANNIKNVDSTSFATAVSTFCNESNGAPALGRAMKAFSDNAKGIDTAAIGLVASALDTITTVVTDLDGYVYDGVDVASFKAKIIEIATAVKEFSEQFPTVDPSGAIAKISSLVTMLSNMNGVNYTGATSFPEALKKLASTSIQGFIDTFGSETTATAVTTAANTLVATGITAIKSDNVYNGFYNAGAYCVRGFAAGITAETFAAEAAAAAMAKAALAAAEAALDENSPSKEFYRIGEFGGMGFVNAFSDYESKSYDSGYAMADSARSGLSDAISRVRNMIEGGIDAQPTIRPVLDLTDVSAGAGRLQSMFGTPSLGLMARVNGINASMNSRQNGTNNDIISAINDLNSRIGDRPANVYNVNGVTYDDGSNIASTVEALVRAAIRERRS